MMDRGPLVVRLPNWVGDVVMAVPALQLLHAESRRIVLVGKAWAASLLQGTGWDVRPYAKSFGARVRQLRTLARTLRDTPYGPAPFAPCFPNSIGSAFELRLAGLRPVGYRNEGRGPLLALGLPMPADHARPHEVQRHWALACRFVQRDLPVPSRIELPSSDAHRTAAERALRSAGAGDRFALIVPFATGRFGAHDKRWPYFAALTQALLQRGRPVVVCPGPGEEAIARAEHPGALVLSGLDLGTYLALMRRAALVVANDTGPGHMAAASGTPLISVVGPSNPAVFGPWGPNVTILHDPHWVPLASVLDRADTTLAS